MNQPDTILYEVPDAEERWQAWEARCLVSHAGHFTSARNASVAFHEPQKPLSALRVALATSGGAYVTGTEPFDLVSHTGDSTVRWIPGDVNLADVRFAHDHYDHTDPDQDPNCMLPLERLRELAAEGIVGSVAPRHIGFMGWIPDPTHFRQETIADVVQQLQADAVDAVVFSPG